MKGLVRMPTPIDRRAPRLRALVTACLLAGCGDNLQPPPLDAGADAPLDAPADAAPLDATADAPDADPCWTHEYPQCGNEIYDLCVPLDGCVFYTCEGQSYGYCGPQS